MAILCCRNQ